MMDPNRGNKRKYSCDMSIDKTTSNAVSVSKEFPEGLRVLALDDSSTCLHVLERMLQVCGYEVTKCRCANEALSILRENKNKIDLVISAVHIPDMDGFKLLEIIRLEMDLPVVMVSSDEKKDVVMENILNGACDYLVKPVRMEAIKFIWQHVVRKRRNSLKASLQSQSKNGVVDGEMQQLKQFNEEDNASSADKENCGSSNIRKYEEEEGKDRDDAVSLKKPRMVWTTELHQQFMAAVNQIGLKNAVPKKILELMNVSGLTRENVASHLQKYRIYLQRQNSNLQHSHSKELNLKLTSLDSCNQLHGHASSNKLHRQSLTVQQAGVESSHALFSSGMPLVDQRNFPNYGIPESRFGIEQQRNNFNLHVNFPHQASHLVDSEPLSHSVQLLGNMDMRMKDGSPYSPNLPTLRISPVPDSTTHGNPSSPLMLQMIGEGTIDCAVPISSMVNDFPKGHVIKLPEHDFCVDATANVSIVGNKNLDYTSYSSYEPTVFIERFDQDDHNLRPFDEHWVGYVEAKPNFNGYLTDNNSS